MVVVAAPERTGGVPLFVEEVTRLLLERGTEGVTRAIPPTLQQLLVARLDRLGEGREVAQIGAVLGRDFFDALLSAVAGAAVAAADYRAVASVADRGPAGLREAGHRGVAPVAGSSLTAAQWAGSATPPHDPQSTTAANRPRSNASPKPVFSSSKARR